MATQLVTKRCDLGSLGVPGLASMFGCQTSWLARMFRLCQDDIILAEANILAYPTVCLHLARRDSPGDYAGDYARRDSPGDYALGPLDQGPGHLDRAQGTTQLDRWEMAWGPRWTMGPLAQS